MAVASAGPYASLHLAPDRQPCQHPTTLFFTGRMPFLPPNQQRQSTGGILDGDTLQIIWYFAAHFQTSSRDLEATTGASVHDLDKEHLWWRVFVGSWDIWSYRSGAKSASLKTDGFAQRYALIVVHATVGWVDWHSVRDLLSTFYRLAA